MFLDAAASVEISPVVVSIMAMELSKDENWKSEQLLAFTTLAKQYLLS